MERQSGANQRGEVEFRRKLYLQQTGGTTEIDDEVSGEDLVPLLRQRMAETRAVMEGLRAAGRPLEPFVEIGAERGQRSLELVNHMGLAGCAVDLSLDMLRGCEHYRALFGLTRSPERIVGDVYQLPFRSGSVSLVFCFQTLHHFPDLRPVLAEVHRVLAPGGTFYFGDEPFDRVMHWPLYQTAPLYSQEHQTRGRLRRELDFFFGEEACNEEAFGILENHHISRAHWREALAPFVEPQVTLRTRMHVEVDLFAPDWHWRSVLAYLLGGTVFGSVRKAGALGELVADPEAALRCPACGDAEAPLEGGAEGLRCPACEAEYPSEEGVRVLLPPAKRRELYPELG